VPLSPEDVAEIQAADKGKAPEEQRVLPPNVLAELERTGHLVTGPNMISDVRSPKEKVQPGAFEWDPEAFTLPLDQLKSRYDAPVWDAFREWAQATVLNEIQTTGGPLRQEYRRGETVTRGNVANVWEWLNGAPLLATPYEQYTNETPSLRIRPGDKEVPPDPALARAAGRAGQRLLRSVYRGLHAQGDAPPAEAINGAEIAAAAQGSKPLFHEQLGGDLARIARGIAAKLPPGAVAASIPGAPGESDHLVVYRPEEIARVFDSDPLFYRPNGEDDAAALRLAIDRHALGELLGYGQRTHFEPASVGVNFFFGDSIVAGFRTRPHLAADLANARVAEYASFLGKKIRFEIK
jgi:hypothetical protein